MSDKKGILDNAPISFFSMIPHMIDDAKLSPQAKTLYLHLKRVTGEEGFCWKTQDQLAKHCGFSPKTVVKAKRELIEAKIIEIKLESFEGHPRHIIHLLNIWPENERKYRQSVPLDTDIGTRPYVTKNTPKEKPLKNKYLDIDLDNIWTSVLESLSYQINKANYRTWLKDIVPLSFNGEVFICGAKNAFIAEYLNQNQRSLIEKTLISVIGDSPISFECHVAPIRKEEAIL
jgi:hypothetical protein